MSAVLKLVPNNLPASVLGSLQHVHTDARRAIEEYNGSDFSVQHFLVGEQASALGNHYHAKKRETFIIIHGSGVIVMREVDQTGRPIGEIFKADLKAGDVVDIKPFMAHTFVLDAGTIMVNYSSARFNPDDMDMTAHTLVDPRTLAILYE